MNVEFLFFSLSVWFSLSCISN